MFSCAGSMAKGRLENSRVSLFFARGCDNRPGKTEAIACTTTLLFARFYGDGDLCMLRREPMHGDVSQLRRLTKDRCAKA